MINKKMKISELLEKFPEAAEILMNKGIGCVMCPMAQQETLEQGLKAHDLKAKEINEVIEEMKKRVKR